MKDIVWKDGFDQKAFKGLKKPKPVQWASEEAKSDHTKDHNPENKKEFSLAKKPKINYLKSKKELRKKSGGAIRSFIFPGAIVKIIKPYNEWVGSEVCTIVSQENPASSDTISGNKYWLVMTPEGRVISVPSSYLRPLVSQNGN